MNATASFSFWRRLWRVHFIFLTVLFAIEALSHPVYFGEEVFQWVNWYWVGFSATSLLVMMAVMYGTFLLLRKLTRRTNLWWAGIAIGLGLLVTQYVSGPWLGRLWVPERDLKPGTMLPFYLINLGAFSLIYVLVRAWMGRSQKQVEQ